MKRAEAAEISGDGVRDLAGEKMDLTAPIVLGSQVQNRSCEIQALQRYEVLSIQIAQRPA
jgi:hypothetical protein